jgi:hypothetical protein
LFEDASIVVKQQEAEHCWSWDVEAVRETAMLDKGHHDGDSAGGHAHAQDDNRRQLARSFQEHPVLAWVRVLATVRAPAGSALA